MAKLRVTVGLCLAIAVGAGKASAQKSGPPPPNSGTNTNPVAEPVRTVNLGNLANPEAMRREIEQAAKEAIIERQKKIERDSARLLKLTSEFKVEVDGLNADRFPPETIRKLEQIEKLAHDVKERTRKK